jgi:glycosyltransferase involved in cell wall biosynthesis
LPEDETSKERAKVSCNPKISIVTPCYNSTNFIHRLHRSLCRQSTKNFEWVLVDDCSEDNTVEVLKCLSPPGNEGISVFCLPQNSGGGVALGFAIEKCKGEIVVMIDHDDELVEDALSVLMDDWPKVAARPEIAGLFYRVLDPKTAKAVGSELRPGTEFSYSWLANAKPDICDGLVALKASIVKQYFNAGALESVCLSGVLFNLMTKKYKMIAGSSLPLQIYHRDNPVSQTNLIKLSRKTVYTYAKYIDDYDINYLRRLVYWAHHLITLIRFSLEVHGTPNFHHRYMKSRWIIAISYFLMPLGIARYYLTRGRYTVIDIPAFPLNELSSLEDCYT